MRERQTEAEAETDCRARDRRAGRQSIPPLPTTVESVSGVPSVNTTGKTGGEEVRASQRRQRRNQAVKRETDRVKDTTKHQETMRQKSIIRRKENDRVEHRQEHPMILLSDSLTAQ